MMLNCVEMLCLRKTKSIYKLLEQNEAAYKCKYV